MAGIDLVSLPSVTVTDSFHIKAENLFSQVPNDGERGSLPILSFAIKEGTEGRPNTRIIPVLTENICWVVLTGRVNKPRDGSCDRRPRLMIREGVMSLIKLAMSCLLYTSPSPRDS